MFIPTLDIDRIFATRFNQLAFGENKDMEDPHMQSETIYKRIATQIEKGCEQLVQHMKMEIL